MDISIVWFTLVRCVRSVADGYITCSHRPGVTGDRLVLRAAAERYIDSVSRMPRH